MERGVVDGTTISFVEAEADLDVGAGTGRDQMGLQLRDDLIGLHRDLRHPPHQEVPGETSLREEGELDVLVAGKAKSLTNGTEVRIHVGLLGSELELRELPAHGGYLLAYLSLMALTSRSNALDYSTSAAGFCCGAGAALLQGSSPAEFERRGMPEYGGVWRMSKRGGLLLALLFLCVGLGIGLVAGYGISELSQGKSLSQVVQDITTPRESPIGVADASHPMPPPGDKPLGFDASGKRPVSEGARSEESEGVPSLAPLVERCRPAVVSVGLYIPEKELEEYRRRMREEMPDQQREGTEIPFLGGRFIPLGSGFVISPEGLIVTNKHVVDVTVEIGPNPTIRLVNGQTYEARIVGTDAETDVALLRVRPSDPMDYMTWADSDRARIGDWVIAIGNPFGLESSVSVGILSARGRQLDAPPGSGGHTYDDYLQTDAAINPGNSGGPLINIKGEVLGINTAIQTVGLQSPFGAAGNIGIGFAIPSNLASWVVERLEAHGEVQRGYIGVQVPSTSAEREAAEHVQGAVLLVVEPDGPAAKAGLRAGDVVVRMGDSAIPDARALIDFVARTEVNAEIEVEFLRDGRRMKTTVRVAKRPPVEQLGKALSEPEDPLNLDDILE